MNESEKFITTGVFSHERNTSGNCSASGCPCRGWSAQESATEHEHEPPARTGEGEWSVQVLSRSARILAGSGDLENKAIIADYLSGHIARQIVTEHNQHHSLLAERERLRRVIREEIDAIRVWQHAIHPRSDVQEGLAISLSKLMNAIDQKEGEMSTRFTISVHQNGYYCVSIPNYHGGEVVKVEEYERLREERERLREALRGVRLMLNTELRQYQSEPWAQRVNEAYDDGNEQGNQPDQKEG